MVESEFSSLLCLAGITLKAMLQGGTWERSEPLRHALLAKAARETGDDIGYEKHWVAAVSAAEGDPAKARDCYERALADLDSPPKDPVTADR